MVNKTKNNNVLGVCLVMIALISVAEATVPPIPKGVVSMPATEPGGFPDSILNDSRIVGLDLGNQWQDIEATEGVYDWSSIDSELVKAEAHGKQVILVIPSGGINVPAWLLANYPAIQTFTFLDPNPYHRTYGQPLTIPVFWDPIFLAKKIALIRAAGAHYASHSSIAVVSCAFANATTDDWNIPNATADIANWLAAGYSTELMVNAGETIIDATMAAFPNQNVVMAIGRNSDTLDPTQDYLAERVVDYATTTYGRFVTTKYSLAANTPDPAVDTALFNWQVLFNQRPNVAGQMLWKVTGDNTYRMNGRVPGNPGTILLNAITIGTHYGMQYEEIYEIDLKNSTLSSVIDTANTLLTGTPDVCYPNYTTAEGCDALSLLTAGAGNTGLGWHSLFLDTTGSFNTGVGAGALVLNNGDSNTAVGAVALLLNTTGTQNTAVGTDALVFNDTGSANTATGYFALMNNTTGGSNTAVGGNALTANTTGNNNTAIGNQALQSNVTTSDHVALGNMAGSGITTADNNIIIGHHSGVHSVFGQVSDRCTIDNIFGAPVSAATAAIVMVDSDGRLGTVTMDGPDPGGFSPKGGIRPQAIPDAAAKQAMFNLKVQNLRATATQQQQQIETLTAQLKEHATQIQKVNAQLEMNKPPPHP